MRQILVVLILFSFAVGILTVGLKTVAPSFGLEGLGLSFPQVGTMTPQSGDLWVSSDGGSEWTQARTQNAATSFVINDLEYYVEGEELIMLAASNDGVYGSRDNGLTWSRLFEEWIDGPAYDIAINPSPRRAVILVAGRASNGFGAIFRSGNGGESFQQTYLTPTTSDAVVGVAFDLGNSSRVLGLTRQGIVLASNDSGFSWGTDTLAEGTFRKLVTYPHEPNTFFALAQRGLYKSSNRGTTWRAIDSLQQDYGVSEIHSISVSPVAETVYLGTDYGLLRSTNRGESFEPLPFLVPVNTVAVTAVAADPRNDARVWVGVDGQLYRTTDGGRSWQVEAIEGAPGTIRLLSVNPTNLQVLYAGFYN